MTACAASPTAAMSSSEMSIADPGKEIRYFVIVRSSGCEFRNWVCIRKPGDHGTAHLAMHARKHLWELLDGVERGVNRAEEFFTKTEALLFIPQIGTSQVLSDPAPEDQ